MRFILAGIFFGFILVRTEVVSWFRIQEMFLFDHIYMYGVFALAILTGVVSLFVIRKFDIKDIDGNEINIKEKDNSLTKRYIIGGICFGLGWGLVGTCPGPLYALIGSGYFILLVPLSAAFLGAATYGMLQSRLPH
jgi:hypothetical protein